MKMFMFKSFAIVAIMFFSVLTGMQLANGGIHKMKGYDDLNFQQVVTLHATDNNNLKASSQGNDLSHNLEAKRKQLEEITTYNFFSSMGNMLSEGITHLSGKIIQRITD